MVQITLFCYGLRKRGNVQRLGGSSELLLFLFFFLFALQLIDEKKNIVSKHTVIYVEPFTHVCSSDSGFPCQVTANHSIGRGRARV